MKPKILLLVFAIFMMACSEDIIDVPNENAYDASIYFNNLDACTAAVNATYASLLWTGGVRDELFRMYDLLSYDARKTFALMPAYSDCADYTHSATSVLVKDNYRMPYKVIFRANFAIDVIGKLTLTTESDIAKASRLIGEVEFIKSLEYYLLVTGYGAIPLKKTLADYDNTQQARTPVSEVWAYIETTLLDAIDRLPVSYADVDGRATKGAAIALLGKVYMQQHKYTDAITQLTKLQSAPFDYQLTDDLDDLFVYGKKTKETIFAIIHGVWQGVAVGDAKIMSMPSEGPASGKNTGTIRQQDYGFLQWWNSNVSRAVVDACHYTDEADNSYYDPRAAKIFYDSYDETGKWSGGDTTYNDNGTGGVKSYTQYMKSKMGANSATYAWRKYETYEYKISGFSFSGDINWQVLRYADVLLMLAESYIEQPSPDLAKALVCINEVRARSGAFEYTTLGAQENARAILRRDRQIEFVGECSRWTDLNRWGILVDEINAEKTKWEGKAPVKPFHVLLPLPQTEVDADQAIIVQNDWN